MKLLLHCCCAPCAVAPLAKLHEDGHDILPWFYNPNIHPAQEYKKRRNTFIEYTTSLGLPAVVVDEYGLVDFVKAVADDPGQANRCPHCYRIRLTAAAQAAKEQGMDAFSTTLLISPYQQHELLHQIGEEIASTWQIPFYYEDFRPLFRIGQEKAKALELYRQGYCGCIYSEQDRYWKKSKGDKK